MKFNLTLPGFGGAAPALPPPPPPLPTESDAEVKKKKDDARVAAGKRQGLLSTNLTSGTGSGTNEEATTTQTKLGGS